MDKQVLSMFMEVTSCESQAYAVQHLGSCRWDLDEAVNLYFTGGGGGGSIDVSAAISSDKEPAVMEEEDDDYYGTAGGNDNVRAPIPARVEALYEDDSCYGYHNTTYASSFGDPVEATGWGEADPDNGTTVWTPSNGGQVGSENVGGSEANDDITSMNTDEDNVQSDDDDNMCCSDNDEDYGFEVDEDSYYASIEDDTDAPTMQRQQQNSLEELYQPPLDLMHNARFHDAKVHSAREDRFLVVNLQTRDGAGDFQSMLQNRDLWSDDQVKNVVKDSFVFLLLQKKSKDDNSLDKFGMDLECSKVCSFYRLEDDQLPAVLVLDPITGQLLAKRSGPMTPDEFVKYVDVYAKSKPSTMCMPKFVRKTPAIAAAVEHEPAAPVISALAAEAAEKAPEIPDSSASASCGEQERVAAPEVEMVDEDDEPMEGEKMYKLRIRFPDSTMVVKEFGCKRRVASLFAFCRSAVHGAGGEAEQKAFRVMRFAGVGFQAVQGDGGATFEELGLNLTTVSVVFGT